MFIYKQHCYKVNNGSINKYMNFYTYSQQLRLLSGIDAPWAANQNNGLINQQNLINWRAVQLETAKLLELSCVLPATNLPYFQMLAQTCIFFLNL